MAPLFRRYVLRAPQLSQAVLSVLSVVLITYTLVLVLQAALHVYQEAIHTMVLVQLENNAPYVRSVLAATVIPFKWRIYATNLYFLQV
jgi:hypothetical protein